MANARSTEQKLAKADAIAAAALALQREVRFEEWTVQQVARRAGVAKGTVFLYFETKEALGLVVARRLLEEWYADLDAQLAGAENALTPASAAQMVARSLEARSPLRRTLALVGPLMEHNAGRAAVARYRLWLLERSSETGRRLEAALPFLRRGEGVRLLLLVHALVVGYHSMAEPSSTVEAVLSDEALAPMRMDFRRVVAEALWMQLEGLRGSRDAVEREGA